MSKKYYLVKLTSTGAEINGKLLAVGKTPAINNYSNDQGQYRKILIDDVSIEDTNLEVGKEYKWRIDTNISYHIRGEFSGILTRILA